MLDAAAESLPDWISAHEAHELVRERNRDSDASTTIAKRACSGLVRAKATLFVWERGAARGDKQEIRDEDADLPQDFWWANGEGALVQNWEAGDFTTWIDNKFQWRAFGVKFDRLGIEAMLAPPAPQPQSEPTEKFTESGQDSERSRQSVKSRKLAHDHPYVAAKTVLDLMNLPAAEQSRLTGPSVGRTMRDYYEQNAGRPPHDDNLDNYGESVLRALKEFWQRQAG